MNLKRYTAGAGVLGVAAALMFAGPAGQADAASANISQWYSLTSCSPSSPYAFCLYYSQGRTGGRDARLWDGDHPKNNAVSTITGTFVGGAGDGQPARNNAASADNGTDCNVGIWVYPGYQGDSDWLSPDRGGNLGPALHNNEASIAVDDSTRCPGTGIG